MDEKPKAKKTRPQIEVVEDYWLAHHELDKVPPRTADTWKFQPPRSLGRRPWHFVNMTYTKAKQEAHKEIGQRIADGPFVLIP